MIKVANIVAGGFFGELAMLYSTRRTAAVVSKGESYARPLVKWPRPL